MAIHSICRVICLLFISSIFTDKTFASAPSHYSQLPPEKQLQMCEILKKKLSDPMKSYRGGYLWPAFKITFSVLAAGGLTYWADIKNPIDMSFQLRQREKMIELRNEMCALRAEITGAPIESFIKKAPQFPLPAKKKFTWNPPLALAFIATTCAIYLILSTLLNKKMHSSIQSLKNFLDEWPDLVDLSPIFLREEVRGLFAAYLEEGISVVTNEKVAENILLAFNVFLTREMEAISQSLHR